MDYKHVVRIKSHRCRENTWAPTRNPPQADDPYDCGKIDTKLRHRFRDQLDDGDYPQMHKLLTGVDFGSQMLLDMKKAPECLQGTAVGDGYYTYEII